MLVKLKEQPRYDLDVRCLTNSVMLSENLILFEKERVLVVNLDNELYSFGFDFLETELQKIINNKKI
jgi:hypothetical protein